MTYFYVFIFIILRLLDKYEYEKRIKFIKKINLSMRRKVKSSKFNKEDQIQLSFVRQNRQLSVQQNRLNVQILRVHTIQKQRIVYQIFGMSQQQLCEYFSAYNLFPYQRCVDIKELLACADLKLIKNQDKIYFGQVDRKKRCGKGVNVTVDGKVFEGQFANNQKCGLGVEIYPNGNLYLGGFQNNKKHGNGNFFWFNLSSKNPKEDQFVEYYQGQWWGGLPDGEGLHQKINGDLYTGNFKNGLKHGQGSQYFSNADTYNGGYVNGLPEGYGQYSWSDGTRYKGDFKQGLRNGYGVWQVAENSKQRYLGHYSMDKKYGYGVYYWQNGWIYKGNFNNDLRSGFGQLYDVDKMVYRGYWKQGQQTNQQVSNANFEQKATYKQFSKTSSHIYDRKTGALKKGNHQDQGMHFNPEERFEQTRRNKSAAKTNKQTLNQDGFDTVGYMDEYILKRRPQSFNSSRRGSYARKDASGQLKGASSQLKGASSWRKGASIQRKGASIQRKGASSQRKAPSTTTKISHNKVNYEQDNINFDGLRQNRTNLNKSKVTGRAMSNGFNSDSHNNNDGFFNFAVGTANIGTTITRPIMKNSNMGNLYVPNQNYNLSTKPQNRRGR